jgi:drug/metabolite transporter (DMT)-like permease
MRPELQLGLLLALGSAFALNWGFVVQHGAAAVLPPLRVRRPLASLRLLFANLRWLTGFLVGLCGWALYVAALKVAPLSLVQAVSAGGIGFLALLVHFRGGERVTRREWVGIGLGVFGLVLLATTLGHGVASGRAPHWSSVAIWIGVSAVVAALAAGPLGLGLAGGAGLGIAAGIFYAAGDVATKAAVGGGARLAFVPAVLAAHGLAFVCLQLGFQRGGALTTIGLSTLLTNALPIAAGLILFHERLPGGAAGGVRALAFALVTACAALLARPARQRPPA